MNFQYIVGKGHMVATLFFNLEFYSHMDLLLNRQLDIDKEQIHIFIICSDIWACDDEQAQTDCQHETDCVSWSVRVSVLPYVDIMSMCSPYALDPAYWYACMRSPTLNHPIEHVSHGLSQRLRHVNQRRGSNSPVQSAVAKWIVLEGSENGSLSH